MRKIFKVRSSVKSIRSQCHIRTRLFSRHPLTNLTHRIIAMCRRTPHITPILMSIELRHTFRNQCRFIPYQERTRSFRHGIVQHLALKHISIRRLQGLGLPLLPPVNIRSPSYQIFNLVPTHEKGTFQTSNRVTIKRRHCTLIIHHITIVKHPVGVNGHRQVAHSKRIIRILTRRPRPEFIAPVIIKLHRV